MFSCQIKQKLDLVNNEEAEVNNVKIQKNEQTN